MQFTIVPHFHPDDERSQIPRLPTGSEGLYRVTFVLSVPGKDAFRERLNFKNITSSGTSLLKAPANVAALKITLSNEEESAEILFSLDQRGLVASAQMSVNALNFRDAERHAFDLISPQLSYWSFLYDVAVEVSSYEIIEQKTESKRYSVGVVGAVKIFDNFSPFTSTAEYRRFFSAYREAVNATSVYYQALSFYKVCEGISALRKRRARKLKCSLPVYPNERIGKDLKELDELGYVNDELAFDAFNPYLGLDFSSVLVQLRDGIRNAIAHLTQLDDVLDSDKYGDMTSCLSAVSVLKVIARTMLKNELNEPVQIES